MDGFRDFSLNTTAFPDMARLSKVLKDAGQRLIIVVDPGLSADFANDKFLR